MSRIEDFAYLHVSDTHLDPRPAGEPFHPDGRSVRALQWFCQQSRLTIDPEARPLTHTSRLAKAPAFAIHTGDVFEYSVVDDCWADWQRVAEALACPVYCVAGNHDNTWSSINRQLRQLYGADSYSFDHGGCHFVCLNSAGSLDPLPCWDERTLRWLADDLAEVDGETPVLLALHHPLSGDAGYASEFDKLRFWEVVRRHRIVLMMDGHWHQVRAGTWQNVPRVNGGETFRLNTGFAMVRVADGVLTQRYHFHDTAEGGARDALVLRHPIDEAAPRYACDLAVEVRPGERQLRIAGVLKSQGIIADGVPPRITAWLDGERKAARQLSATDSGVTAGEPTYAVRGEVDASTLAPGRHFATVRFESQRQTMQIDSEVGEPAAPVANEQAVAFELPDSRGRYAASRYQGGAGIKTRLAWVDSEEFPQLIFGDTAGVVTALDAAAMQPLWRQSTGREILHALTAIGSTVVAGDSDGVLHVLDTATGKPMRELRGFAPIFAPGAVIEGVLYFGDANGWLHAIDTATWKRLWSRDVAQFAFESAPLYDSRHDRLLLGSWDGYYYAVSRADGAVAWKAWNAQGQVAAKSRYYGPADSSPVIVGDELWGADRSYRLGRYRLSDGEFLGQVREQVAAISAIGAGAEAGVVARGLDDRLIRFQADGGVAWETEMPLGRSPIPPTSVAASPTGDAVLGALVGATSDRGLFTLVDAATGEKQLQWSMTPGLFVLAPVAASPDGRAWFAAGMDGVVTRVARAEV